MLLDDVVKVSQILQVAFTAGVFWVAVKSLQWAQKTFARQEEHEAAKRIAYTAFHLGSLNPPGTGGQLPPSDFSRVIRWWNVFNGKGNFDVTLPAQWVTCYLTNFGPGLVTSAEVPYTVTIFDWRPVDASVQAADTSTGRFRFFNVSVGQPSAALTALNTTYYPFVRIQLGDPIIHDITGNVVVVPPDPELTQNSSEYDNASWWQGYINQQRNQRNSQAQQTAVTKPQA